MAMLKNKSLSLKLATDILFSFFLFIVSLYFIYEAEAFQVSGANEKPWSLSAAMFPQVIFGLIALLSAAQVVGKCRTLAKDELTLPSSDFSKSKAMKAGTILLFLVSYIAIYVPNTDFLLASIFFVSSVVVFFYYDVTSKFKGVIVSLNVFVTVCVIATQFLDIEVQNKIFLLDFILLFVLCLFLPAVITFEKSLLNGKGVCDFVLFSILIPTLITVVFKYGLKVLMPVEGRLLTTFDFLFLWLAGSFQ